MSGSTSGSGQSESASKATPSPSDPGDSWQKLKAAADYDLEHNDLKSALTNLQRAVKLMEASGVDTSLIIQENNRLARFYETSGDLPTAEGVLEHSLALAKKGASENTPDIAQTYSQLRGIYARQKQFGKSEQAARQALVIMEKVAGPDDPGLEQYINDVLGVACLNGTCKDESPLTERLYKLRVKQYGSDHPKTMAARQMLAEAKEHHQQYKEAQALYEKNLEIAGKTSQRAASYKINVARTLMQQKKFHPAQALLDEILKDKNPSMWRDQALHLRAQLYMQSGHADKALADFEKLISSQEDTLGGKSPSLAKYYFEYADLLRQSGKNKAAEAADAKGSALSNQPLPGEKTH